MHIDQEKEQHQISNEFVRLQKIILPKVLLTQYVNLGQTTFLLLRVIGVAITENMQLLGLCQ